MGRISEWDGEKDLEIGVSKMAQQVQRLLCKPEGLGLSSRTHTKVKVENQLLRAV